MRVARRFVKGGSAMVDRRLLLAGARALALIAGMRWLRATDVEAATSFEVQKSDS